MITTPGLVHDLDSDEYHADAFEGGSLSASGAKTLLLRTPAQYQWEREHGRPNKPSFDFGHAAHRLVLGDGPEIVRVDADSWRTKAAKEQADEARAEGKTPLLAADVDTVTAMAEALRAHPLAASLLEPGSGRPEVSAFARDERTGVTMRCRYDWLRTPKDGLLTIPDYKTTTNADAEQFLRSAYDYGYPLQHAFYVAIARALGLAEDVEFLFVAQEKTPPYLVNVIGLDTVGAQIGEKQMRAALDLYAHCTRTGVWPGYPSTDEPVIAPLPVWVERLFEDDMEIRV